VALAQPEITPGATQTLTVQTAPNAQISVTVHFPGGQTVTAPATADSIGAATVVVRVPLHAFSPDNPSATASVSSTIQNLTRHGEASFTVTLPRLALFLSKTHIHTGKRERITIVSQTHARIKLTITFPNGTVWTSTSRTGDDGTLTYSFTVPKHHMRGSNHTVVVRAKRLTGGRASAHKSFHVFTG
jgi:hypothetical protein